MAQWIEAGGEAMAASRRLARFDLLVLRRSFAVAFAGWRDRLLLLIVAAIGLLWLRDAAGAASFAHDRRIVLAIGALAGWTLARAVRQRLVDHRQGLLAAAALDPAAARLHAGAMSGIGLLLLLAIAALVLPRDLLPLAAGLGGGAASAFLLPLAGEAPRLSVARFGSGQLPGLRRAPLLLALLLAAAPAAVARLALVRGSPADAAFAAGLAELAVLAGLVRSDAQVARFLAMSGFGPLRSAALQLGPAALFWFASTAILLPLAGTAAASLAGLAGGALLLLALARLWLFRLHERRVADAILGFGLAAAAILFAAAPPLAALGLLAMIADLYRRAGRVAWLMP